MKLIWLIQDVETKKYYGQYFGSDYFSEDVNDVMHFPSKQRAVEEFNSEYFANMRDKMFEIKEYVI